MNPIDAFALGFGLAAIFSGACAWSYCRRFRHGHYQRGYIAGCEAGRRAAYEGHEF
jgi:hypothetical protein